MSTLLAAFSRLLALLSSLGFLGYTVARVYWLEAGQDTMSGDMFSLVLAVCLVLLAVLVQRHDSSIGRFLSSW